MYVGTFPVVALMVGNAVTRLSSASSVCDDSGNSTTTGNTSNNASSSATSQEESDPCFQNSCETLAVDVAVTLSFLVGVIMVKENFNHRPLVHKKVVYILKGKGPTLTI